MARKPRWPGIHRRKDPEYNAWVAAKQRCHNPNDKRYHLYGGRGITVCDEWRRPGGFAAFYEHIGPRPGPGWSLDRIDNDRGYEPGNVQWATQQAQLSNTRRTVLMEWRGVQLTVAEWARVVSIDRQTLRRRVLAGWTAAEAIETPIRLTKANRSRPKTWANYEPDSAESSDTVDPDR